MTVIVINFLGTAVVIGSMLFTLLCLGVAIHEAVTFIKGDRNAEKQEQEKASQ